MWLKCIHRLKEQVFKHPRERTDASQKLLIGLRLQRKYLFEDEGISLNSTILPVKGSPPFMLSNGERNGLIEAKNRVINDVVRRSYGFRGW